MQDPIARFGEWLADAHRVYGEMEAAAMTLATATPDGMPSARMVLLKQCDANGFVFYTNLESDKSRELMANPRAALCWHWQKLGRQVRAQGSVTRASDAEADAYYASRHPQSRLGAWASQQSRPLQSRAELEAKLHELEARYPDANPPRPPYWGGWRVRPERIEFWQEGEFRLHDRDLYTRAGNGWHLQKLYP